MPPQKHQPTRPPPAPQRLMSSSYSADSDDMAAFYAAWARREEELAAALAAALPTRRRNALAPLVAAALDHVAAYYEHKARLADRDVVAALDLRWLNPLERTFLWAWGWKPALAFRFAFADVDGSGSSSSPSEQQQRAALEDLRAATAAAEREVDREVAAVQESLAGPRVLAALCRQSRQQRNGGEDDAVAALGHSLRVLLATADALRERTVRSVVALLAPEQAGEFVAAMLGFHISVRRAGRGWSAVGRRGI